MASSIRLPITGDITTDFMLIVGMVVLGVVLGVKAEKKWGWLLLPAALAWAFYLAKSRGWV